MLHYLIKITDNTLSVVIVFSLLCALSSLVSRKGERKFLLFGVATGFAAALVYAILKRNTGVAVREYYDLGVMLPSLLFSLVLFVALWPLFGEGKEAGTGVRALVALLLATLAAYALPSILLYPFEFAVGMESIFNTEFLYRVAGFCSGLLLMFLLGLGLFRMSTRLPRSLLRALLFAVLLVFFAKLSLEVTQILVARNLVPRAPWLMSLVIFALTHANGFAFAMMGLAAFLAGALVLRIGREPVREENPAIRRRQRAEHRRLYAHVVCVSVCLAVSALTITELRDYASEEVEISPPLDVAGVDGEIRIPIDSINDGNLHRFQYRTDRGTGVRFIVIRKSESAYGVGLDACDICGPSGYYQRKGQVICKLCDVVINIATIGFPGGCNPVPLRFDIAQGYMRILTEDLDAEQERFQGHSYSATPVPESGSQLSRLIREASGQAAPLCSGHGEHGEHSEHASGHGEHGDHADHGGHEG